MTFFMTASGFDEGKVRPAPCNESPQDLNEEGTLADARQNHGVPRSDDFYRSGF